MERPSVRFTIPKRGSSASRSDSSRSDTQHSRRASSTSPQSSQVLSSTSSSRGGSTPSGSKRSGTLLPLDVAASSAAAKRKRRGGDMTSITSTRGTGRSISGSSVRSRSGAGSVSDMSLDEAPQSTTKAKPVPSLNPKPATVRVITSFRGVVVPEYKGHIPRTGHTAVMYKRDLYVFGGVNAAGVYPNHLHRHEKRSLQWEEVRGLGVVPSGRANHSSVLVGDKMYVFGGHKGLDVFDDLFCFNMDSIRWERIGYDKTQGPGPCFLHSAIYVPVTQSMIVLGGFHQREHNMYMGHSFDIKNKVWSGIPGPLETNPQHIQIVTTALCDERNSVVVLGVVDEEDAISRSENASDMPPPSVYLLNIHSHAWTKVDTTHSPESPIPFCLEIVWEEFMREFRMMGGFHDEAQDCWYFPINLSQVDAYSPIKRRGIGWQEPSASSGDGRESVVSGGGRQSKQSQYGFFVLRFSDFTWSIIPIAFPKKILVELAAKNRERASNHAIAEAAAHLNANGNQLMSFQNGSSVVPNSMLDADSMEELTERLLQMSTASGNIASSGALAAKMAQSRGEGSVTSGHSTAYSGMVRPSLTASTKASMVAPVDRFRKLLMYTVQGAHQFQRKYSYAAYREKASGGSGTRGKKSKPMKYMMMHGGLSPGEDYAMLMFTPVSSRGDNFQSRNGKHSSHEGKSSSGRKKVNVWEDVDEESDSEEGEGRQSHRQSKSRSSKRAMSTTSSRASSQDAYVMYSGASSAGGEDAYSVAGGEDDLLMQNAYAPETAEKDEEAEAHARADCLLPTLPCTRTSNNTKRFAVMYSTANSVRDSKLLPYQDCPVAILESEKDVLKWSEHHYRGTRRWLGVKLKETVAEDRQIRRARKRLMRQYNPSLGRSTTSSAWDGLGSSDDDGSDDSGSTAISNTSGGSSFWGGKGNADSLRGNLLDQALASTEAGVLTAGIATAEEQRRAFVKDFFEKRGLDIFNLDQFLAAQAAARYNTDSRTHKGTGVDPLGLSQSGASSGALGASGAGDGIGTERLRTTAKRHEERQRLPNSVFAAGNASGNGSSVGNLNALSDLGSAMAYVLMHNALAALQSDLSLEASVKRARIRWRFLRALVRTGEAAFIIYRASQETSKMKAVKVTSTPGLLLAPELHLIGPTRAYRVPSRPIPYALPRPAKQTTRFAEMTTSGMVVYHNMRHVK